MLKVFDSLIMQAVDFCINVHVHTSGIAIKNNYSIWCGHISQEYSSSDV